MVSFTYYDEEVRFSRCWGSYIEQFELLFNLLGAFICSSSILRSLCYQVPTHQVVDLEKDFFLFYTRNDRFILLSDFHYYQNKTSTFNSPLYLMN